MIICRFTSCFRWRFQKIISNKALELSKIQFWVNKENKNLTLALEAIFGFLLNGSMLTIVNAHGKNSK